MIIDAVELTKELISKPSVTPEDAGAIEVLEKYLDKLGFKYQTLIFTDKKDPNPIKNLYARFGNKGKNLCFAGHTDVVPPGDLKQWKSDPFKPEIRNGVLYGRGAADMKAAIAAWVAATSEFLDNNKKGFAGSLSLLITGDEEAISINGTKKVLEWMKKTNEKIDACIVGEPTNPNKLGEMIKIGRRGSISFDLAIEGTQGHVAYPHIAENPATKIINILHELKNHKLDKGNKFFQPSNLEITTIDIGNPAANVIPAKASAKFNIRFNDYHTSKSLTALVNKICRKYKAEYKLISHITGESFITKPGQLSHVVSGAIKKITGITPKLSTTGGTSDARFIKDFCPVVEFGALNKTAHKVDECIAVKDLKNLTRLYKEIITSYFN